MTDPIERLRAAGRAYPHARPADRARLARRAVHRRLRWAATGSSGVACAAAVALVMSAPSGSQSLRVTSDPVEAAEQQRPDGAAAEPTAGPPAAPAAASPVPVGTPIAAVGADLPNGDRVEVTAGPPVHATIGPSPAPTPPPPPPSTTPGDDSTRQPKFWTGTYGAAPFYGRQVIRNHGICQPRGGSDPISQIGPQPTVCLAAEIQPPSAPLGTYLFEAAVCLGDDATQNRSGGSNSGYENRFKIQDETAQQVVGNWAEPASWQQSTYTLTPGDCVVYLWSTQLLKDSGAPLASGHFHHINYEQPGLPENFSPQFRAP